MASSPLVSVLLPVSNAEGIIGDAIVSVLRQTLSDFELIIVDDASEDMSARVIRGFAAHDKRIRFHRSSKKCGTYENYNQCLQISTGKYIKPLSQNALLLPTALDRLVEVLQRKPAVALVSYKTNHIEAFAKASFGSDVRLGFVEIASKILNQSNNFIGDPNSVLFRKEYVSGGFDKRLTHLTDIDYWLRILQNGDFFYVNEVLCNIQEESARSSHSTQDMLQVLLEWLLIARKNENLFQKTGENPIEFCQQSVRKFLSKISVQNDVNDIFASFETDPSKPRDLVKEVHAFAMLCIMDTESAPFTTAISQAVKV